MEGFTHLIPFAAGHEVIRQGRKRLTLIRMTPDLIYDQLIGMGAAEKLVFSWGGNPGVGSLHRLRDAVENGWPQPLALEEHSHAAMANAYEAGAANLPFAVFRGYKGVDLPKVNPNIRSVTCPYTGEVLATVPAIRPDVAIIHALRADRAGNVLLEGIVGVQKEAVLAAKRSIVTVEEVVDDFGPRSPNAVILPAWTIVGHRAWCRAARSPPTRTATTSAPTPSTRPGTRSPATARRSSHWMRRERDGEDAEDFAQYATAGSSASPPPCGEGLGRGLDVPHSRIDQASRLRRNNRMARPRRKGMWSTSSRFAVWHASATDSDRQLRCDFAGCRADRRGDGISHSEDRRTDDGRSVPRREGFEVFRQRQRVIATLRSIAGIDGHS